MAFQNAVYLTGDGVAERRKSLKNAQRLGLAGTEMLVAPGSPDVSIGTADIDVIFDIDNTLGSKGREFCEQYASSLEQRVRVHVRSFLARLDVNATILKIRLERNRLFVRHRLSTAMGAVRSHQLRSPAYVAMRRYIVDQSLPISDLLLYPEEAQPFDGDFIQKEINDGTLVLPKGWEIEGDGHTVRIPIAPELDYNPYAAITMLPEDWSSVLRLGKRRLRDYQKLLHPHSPTLRTGFDVRGTTIAVRHGYALILEETLAHEDPKWHEKVVTYVRQHHSPRLEAHDLEEHGGRREARIIELRTAYPDIPVRGLKARAKLYRVVDSREGNGSVSVPLSIPMTLNHCIADHGKDIQDLLDVIGKQSEIAGVLVNADGPTTIVNAQGPPAGDVVRHIAHTSQLPDERDILRLAPDVRRIIEEHPGVRAMKQAASNRSNHYFRRAWIASVHLQPWEMRELALQAGVCAFIARALRPSAGIDDLAKVSVTTGSIEAYAQHVRQGDYRMFWDDPRRTLRELHGLTFVDHRRLADFRNLDHVTAVFCSHRPGMEKQLNEQLPQWLDPLSEEGCQIGIATGASTGGMKDISDIILEKYPQVLLIGSANILPGQKPSFQEHAMTLFDSSHRRHRQTLLVRVADQFVALNGGRGTIGEIAEIMVDTSTKFCPPCPIGLVDLSHRRGAYWKPLCKMYDNSVKDVLTQPWIVRQMHICTSLADYAAAVRVFRSDPLGWWGRLGVPADIVAGSLRTHVQNCVDTGRHVATYLEPACEQYGIDPQALAV